MLHLGSSRHERRLGKRQDAAGENWRFMVITIRDQRGTGFCYQDYFINRSTARDGNAPDVDRSFGNEGREREREESLRFWPEYNRKRKSRRAGSRIKGERRREREERSASFKREVD